MSNYLRAMTAKLMGSKEQAIGYKIIGDWEAPAAMNDAHFGEPTPDKPKRPKLKLGARL
jgi:hypothetical protein